MATFCDLWCHNLILDVVAYWALNRILTADFENDLAHQFPIIIIDAFELSILLLGNLVLAHDELEFGPEVPFSYELLSPKSICSHTRRLPSFYTSF